MSVKVQSVNRNKPSVYALILANLIVLIGAIFLGWDVTQIMTLFWMENVVIGAYNVVKILTAQGKGGPKENRFFTAGFFMIHYGAFCFGHGVFLFMMLGVTEHVSGGSLFLKFKEVFSVFGHQELWYGLSAIILSHGYSLFKNYFGKKEFLKLSVSAAMNLPYRRVMLLHIVIMASSFILMGLGNKMTALVILVVIKTILDVRQHLSEHNPNKKMSSLFG